MSFLTLDAVTKRFDDIVAVVGDHMWAAKKGLEKLVITWNEGQNAEVNSAMIWADIKAASNNEGAIAKASGDADKALQDGIIDTPGSSLPTTASYSGGATATSAATLASPTATRPRSTRR